MLDLFGLQQGEEDVIKRYYFYAKGLPRSAANIRVDSNGNIDQFNISDALQDVISSSESQTIEPVAMQAFPSPLRVGDALSVQMPFEVLNGTFELIDAYGRQVAAWPVDAAQGQVVQYTLPANVQAGMYAYRLVDRNTQLRGIGKLNVIR